MTLIATATASAGIAEVLSSICCTPTPTRGCGMVEVTGGTFRMGQADAYGTGIDSMVVTVSGYAMDSHEVTVARFRRFWEAGHPEVTAPVPYPGGHQIDWLTPASFGRSGAQVVEPATTNRCTWTAAAGDNETLPINCVSYYTALAFCVWDGGRLPTATELHRVSAARKVTWRLGRQPGALPALTGASIDEPIVQTAS